MTLLHVVIFVARKSAEETLNILQILLQRGCRELINEPDSLSNTPLHALMLRYALEEARYGYDKWSKYDVMSLVRFLLKNGAKNSINQPGNSALACVFRHVRDWEVCFELLSMLIKEDGNPNIVGRDGSVPIMVCLVPLINKDQLHHFTHSMKVCYLNCIRILLQNNANPNCSYHSNLSPLHVLAFTVSENFTLNCDTQKRTNFEFIKNILLLLLQHGLDCNQTYPHVLQTVMEMVSNVRTTSDMLCLYELALTLIQYGADPNIVLSLKPTPGSTTFSHEIAHFNENICHMEIAEPDPGPALRQYTVEHFRNSFRTNSRYILFYYTNLITKKEFLLTDPELTYTRIIQLFFITMQHESLYNCLKSLYNFYVAQVPNKKTEQLVSLISELYRKPRSLKQLCRLAIYTRLNRKLAQNINELKLPGPVKEYVLNFEK